MVAQSKERTTLVGGFYKDGEVVVTPPVGDHVHGDLAQGIEDLRFEAYVVPLHVPYDADDCHIVLDIDGA